jgi:hypothetical protein
MQQVIGAKSVSLTLGSVIGGLRLLELPSVVRSLRYSARRATTPFGEGIAKPEPVLLAQIRNKVAGLGRIRPFQPSFSHG